MQKNIKLYPLRFNPLFLYRIWGGSKLKSFLNKDINKECIGESWELSDVSGHETKVSNGELAGKTLKDLIKIYGAELLGSKIFREFGNDFPLLIKFIDAKTPLSIQVHPNEELAKKRHNSFGKNEMWYVVQAEENAELLVGFASEISLKDYKGHLENGTILDVLNHEKVVEGDAFYIPSGRIHAIGAGVLLAEIQQTSDITYRIFDYNRVDDISGKKRELHNHLANDVIDFNVYDFYKTSYIKDENVSNSLVHSPYFKSNILLINKKVEKNYSKLDSFVIYICVKGELSIQFQNEEYNLNFGETILIPANVNHLILDSSKARVIEVYL